jgi:hypothetical protein
MPRFTHFQNLDEILFPGGGALHLDLELGVLTLLKDNALQEQQLVSPSEMYIIEALLKNYPEYCPYEVVLSAMTGKSIEQCREKVLWGLEKGTVDVVMRPVRNLLGRCRMKLKPFGLEVKSMINMGYLIIPLKRRAGEKVSMQ